MFDSVLVGPCVRVELSGKEDFLTFLEEIPWDALLIVVKLHLYFDRPDRGYKKDIAVATAKAFQEGRELTDEELHNLTYTMKDGKEVRRNPKGDWGYIYKQEDRYFLNINFQTRFR